MSSPIEKYKAELQAMLKFDCNEFYYAYRDFDFTDKNNYGICETGSRWQHTKTAKIAQALLDAVEALTGGGQSVRETLALMSEGEGSDPEVYRAMAKHALDSVDQLLEKLSKGDE